MQLGPEPGRQIRHEAAHFLFSPFSPLPSSIVRSFLVSPTDPSILVMGLCCAGVEFKEQRQPCVILPCLPASPLPLVIPAANRDNYRAGFPAPGIFPSPSASLPSGLWSAASRCTPGLFLPWSEPSGQLSGGGEGQGWGPHMGSHILKRGQECHGSFWLLILRYRRKWPIHPGRLLLTTSFLGEVEGHHSEPRARTCAEG